MPLTPAQVDAAIPVSGTPVRSLTNSALKQLITDIADVGVGLGVGTVNTFADLPAASTVAGQRWWVLQSTGVWLVNRKTKGAYYSNGTTWDYLGDFPVTAAEVGNVPGGTISAGNVQAAIDELDSEKAPKGAIGSSGLTQTTARILGRVTAGVGAIEELTYAQVTAAIQIFTGSLSGAVPASGGGTSNFLRADGTWAAPPGGGGGSPGGLTTQVQYNNAGAFDGAARFVVDAAENPGLVPYAFNASPPAPTAGVVTLFSRTRAGKALVSVTGPEGETAPLQAHTGIQAIRSFSFSYNSTTILTRGFGSATAVGTATAQTAVDTNVLTRMPRLGWVSAGTANASAGLRSASGGGARNLFAGRYNWFLVVRFAVPTSVSDRRLFIGLHQDFALFTGDPSVGANNLIGIGLDGTDGNLQIMTNNGSANANKVDLGSLFPAPGSTDVYEVRFFQASGASSVGYYIENLATGATANGTVSAQVPAAGSLLAFQAGLNNNATASAVTLVLASVYLESDY